MSVKLEKVDSIKPLKTPLKEVALGIIIFSVEELTTGDPITSKMVEK